MEHKYEKKQDVQNLAQLKEIIKYEKYIKLSDLNKLTPQELKDKPRDYVGIFYVESFSIIEFLVKKWPKYKLSNFFKLLKDGYAVNEALCKVYNIRNLDELEERWIKFYQQ